jgi:hypothetical protein
LKNRKFKVIDLNSENIAKINKLKIENSDLRYEIEELK